MNGIFKTYDLYSLKKKTEVFWKRADTQNT